jgi:hypothetical protein
MDPILPPVLDPALANCPLTIVEPNGAPIIDPRTGRPIRFTTVRAARQQCVAWKVPVYRIAPL